MGGPASALSHGTDSDLDLAGPADEPLISSRPGGCVVVTRQRLSQGGHRPVTPVENLPKLDILGINFLE